MKRQNRTATFETVEIPVSVLAESDLADKWLPALSVINDSELKKMGERGRQELERREAVRAEHVAAGRVRYVYRAKGYQDDIWVVSSKTKGNERDKNGRLIGNVAQTSYDGRQLALMALEYEDRGGVVYIEDWDGKLKEIVDLRPNECEALAATGKHDWFYVPTGDDVCRSCGLVS